MSDHKTNHVAWKKTALLLVVLLFIVKTTLVAASLTLVENKKSGYVITLPAKPSEVQRTASKELQTFLKKATGAELAIRSEAEVSSDTPQILVGPSKQLKRLLPSLNLAALPPDGIVIKTIGKHLILAGAPPRGTLYAAYTFLEKHVGIRWWTPDATFIPDRPTLKVGELEAEYAPPFLQRSTFYREPCHNPVFAARLKLNGHHQNIPPAYGGNRRIIGFVHTFNRLLPPDTHFKEHPEWYSLINGKRVPNEQLCLSNDAMRKELTKVALSWIKRQRGAGMISISQNDRHCGACECDACKAIRRKYGDVYAGDLIWFINKVAADIEKTYPDVLVETLAYHYTRTPPKNITPRKSVIVRLCSIECSFLQPLGTGKQNESFRNDIEGWSAIAPHLFVWNYVTNFRNYILPHPNLRVLAPNIRFFSKNHVKALFEQGDIFTTVGDFVRLRAWVLAHLMWDPSQDEKALIREFMNGYYQKAAPFLLDYLKLTHDAAEKSNIYLRCYMNSTDSWFPPETLNRATAFFNKALEAVKGDAELTRRVTRAKIPLDNVWLKRYKSLEIIFKASGKKSLGPADPRKAAQSFIRKSHEFQNKYYAEGRPFAEYERQLRERFIRKAGPPPEKCRSLEADRWIDFQDAFFRLSHRDHAQFVDDPNASDGKAARMPGDHFEWAVQCALTDEMKQGNPWHCYVSARCDAKKDASGPALRMGIYDARSKKGVTQRTITVKEASGTTYKVFDLGVHDLHGGCYVWVAPVKRPKEVQAVFIDRMFFVKDGERKK